MVLGTDESTPIRALYSGARPNPRAQALVSMLQLHWFIRLRWVFLLGSVVVLAVERFVITRHERPFELMLLLAGLGVTNLFWTAWSHLLFRRYRADRCQIAVRTNQVQLFANAQVAVDLLLLTGILRFMGGAQSPLLLFYLFHMAIISLLLSQWQALLQGFWALLLYGLLAVGEWLEYLRPYYPFLPDSDARPLSSVEATVALIVVATCGIFGILYFTLHIAARLHKREEELERTNRALRQSQLAIQDLQRRRSRFMQTAAHQLKSPLAIIQTLTDLIRSGVVGPEAVPGTCDKIIRRCQEGIIQVAELLTLARVQDASPERHRLSQASIREVVDRLYDHFLPVATQKGLTLNKRLPPEGDLLVCVDPADLKECVSNLVENAIKYTPGPGDVWIRVVPKMRDHKLAAIAVTVTDTGIGVDPGLLRSADGEPGHQTLFEAFRRGHNVIEAAIPGSGLGLSIVREVVEQAGGRIHVTSRPGHGSSFTVSFPAIGTGDDHCFARNTRASEVVIEPGDETPA